jgi:hypothetical protein
MEADAWKRVRRIVMEVVLLESMFTNNKCYVTYGNREAVFTIIDEEFAGNNHLGRVNRITVLVRQFDSAGAETAASLHGTVIGLGDGVAGVRSDDAGLRGKLLTRENMDKCVVELYEDT